MPLSDLLYRCPACGRDPMEGKGDRAWCPACGTHYARGGSGARIRIRRAGEPWRAVPAPVLVDAIGSLGESQGNGSGGGAIREASATLRVSQGEEPLRFRREILGFFEQYGEVIEGTVRLDYRSLHFTSFQGALRQWELLDLRSLQSSSSSIQFSDQSGTLHQLRFETDSPRRWEDLLRCALSRRWAATGRGKIVEFQPRIVSR